MDKFLKLINKDKNKRLFFYFIPAPLLSNLLLNIYNEEFVFAFQNSSKLTEQLNLILGFFLFIFYVIIGHTLKSIFSFEFVCTGVILFWIIIFALDNFLLFFTKNLSFSTYLSCSFIIFVISIFFITKVSKKPILLIFMFTFLRTLTKLMASISSDLSIAIDQLYTSDEIKLWYPALRTLYEDNYYSIFVDNPYEGYGLLTSYVSSINTFILNQSLEFKYYPGINYLFIFLFFYFLFEVANSKKTLLINYLIFLPILLTSSWFTYVFFGSLLSECVSSFCFGVLFTEINKSRLQNTKSFSLLMLMFGFLYYTRQFISTIVLVYLIYLLFNRKNVKIFIGFSPFLLKWLQSIFFPGTSIDPYIKEGMFENIYFNYSNIIKTILQFAIDKPVTYLFIIFFALTIIYPQHDENLNDFYLVFLINLLFVFGLVVFLWNKPEVQSSYRYILNTFYLILYPLTKIFDSQFEENN